ncbi:MAG: phospholipid carrier-dependent glycosyltransferase [Catenulispora sp.]|nr:phospholipid carrier-dependent glycosyltransferase [Catenulispora sp.]
MAGWCRAHPDALIITGLVLLVVAVQGVNIANFPTVSDDEGTYLAQAWAIQHGKGLAHYSYWYDHPPLGWIQIAALSWLPEMFDHGSMVVMHARVIMLPVSAISSALVYVLCRRLGMARWAAALGVVVYGLSPLSVTMQREIYLDNFAVVWMVAAFVLALSPRRHLWHHVAAGFCAAAAILSKETMLVVAPALLWAVWQGSDKATRKFSLTGFLSTAGLVIAQYPLYALLKGELFAGAGHNSLFGAISYQLGRKGGGNIFQKGSVSNLTLHWWLVRDPVLMYAGTAAVFAALVVRRLRPVALAGVILVVVGSRPSGYLPAMYVIQAIPFFAVCIAGLVDEGMRVLMLERTREWLRRFWRWEVPWRRIDVAALSGVVAVGLIAPVWQTGDATADTAFANDQYAQASAWIREHVPDRAHTRIVVDDAMWPDLADQGFQPGLGVIWFYKVDLDPAVTRTLPRGWRDIDYVVSTTVIRQDPNGLPTVRQAMEHSATVATFGSADQRIDILKVEK